MHRLRRARERHGLDAVFDPKAWPLEWVNQSGTPRAVVNAETAVLAQHEPELFGRYTGASWPSTLRLAFLRDSAVDHAGAEIPLAVAAGGSATNPGTAALSYLGGITLTAGLGYTAPTRLGTTMAILALTLTIPMLTHRTQHHELAAR